MIIDARLVELCNIVQGHADVVVAGIGFVGFVEQQCGKEPGWFTYGVDGGRISDTRNAKREWAVRDLAKRAIDQEAAA